MERKKENKKIHISGSRIRRDFPESYSPLGTYLPQTHLLVEVGVPHTFLEASQGEKTVTGVIDKEFKSQRCA